MLSNLGENVHSGEDSLSVTLSCVLNCSFDLLTDLKWLVFNLSMFFFSHGQKGKTMCGVVSTAISSEVLISL